MRPSLGVILAVGSGNRIGYLHLHHNVNGSREVIARHEGYLVRVEQRPLVQLDHFPLDIDRSQSWHDFRTFLKQDERVQSLGGVRLEHKGLTVVDKLNVANVDGYALAFLANQIPNVDREIVNHRSKPQLEVKGARPRGINHSGAARVRIDDLGDARHANNSTEVGLAPHSHPNGIREHFPRNHVHVQVTALQRRRKTIDQSALER